MRGGWFTNIYLLSLPLSPKIGTRRSAAITNNALLWHLLCYPVPHLYVAWVYVISVQFSSVYDYCNYTSPHTPTHTQNLFKSTLDISNSKLYTDPIAKVIPWHAPFSHLTISQSLYHFTNFFILWKSSNHTTKTFRMYNASLCLNLCKPRVHLQWCKQVCFYRSSSGSE